MFKVSTALHNTWVASESCPSFRDSCSMARNFSVNSCIIATVTFALLWSLLLKFEEGPVGITTPDVDTFTALFFTLLGG